jgi:hypothetical protein
MRNSGERLYTKEEVREMVRIYHEWIDGQMESVMIEGGVRKFQKGILAKMNKYPIFFADEIKSIERALNY